MLYMAQMLSVLYGALLSFIVLELIGRTHLLSSIIPLVYLPLAINALSVLLLAISSLSVWTILRERHLNIASVLMLSGPLILVMLFLFY